MTMSDPLGDMLTRIRNGQRARQAVVAAPASKLRANVLEVLKREGYIRGFTHEQVSRGVAELKIELKYVDGEPVIREIARVSKPGRRMYSGISDLPRVYNGLGIA
ncbi:MAG: 30S ribosomal protein S8, partial [Alphaproteobacteria bacterium]|nr:30S ribosomal protein S8 [Alphaproteobacteria bacterium]